MRTRVLTLTVAVGLGALAALPTLPAAAKSVSTSNLKALSNTLNKGKHLTYEVQYTSVSDGKTTTVTIAEAPPKSYFGTTSGAVIDTGKTTYYCASSGDSGNSGDSGSGTTGSSGNTGSSGAAKATQTCVAEKGANSLLGLEDLFNPTGALAALSEAENKTLAHALGVRATSSSASFAGQPSTCITVTVRAKTGKYCVTKQGLLSYSGSSKSSYFKLTKYSAKPSASLFTLPAGATTETIPESGSLP